jgi:cyclase
MGRLAHIHAFLLPAMLFAGCVAVSGADYGKVTVRKTRDGIYLFTTSSYGDVGMCGNSVAIVTGDCVIVFDSGAVPDTAAAILRGIREITPLPVRYLVNSHWHWDHWGGNQVFKSAFPGISVISHEKTREQMLTVEPRWNEDGLQVQLPRYVAALEARVTEARARGGPEADIRAMEDLLRADRNFLDQKRTLEKVTPDVTFSGEMTIRTGGRTLILEHARGITAGDTYIFLPEEKVLLTGDLMIDPYPFAVGGTFPTDWLATLEHFASLNPSLILPGHGAPQSAAPFIGGHIALFKEVMRQVRNAKARGDPLERIRASLRSQAGNFLKLLGKSDSRSAEEMPGYFLDVFAARRFEELDHRLGDLPSGLPAAKD